ncbi:MAG: hypothetical protein ACRDN6_00345 [Gaiellaceae bacterium]
MRRRAYFMLFALGLLVLALLGWTAEGIRWSLTGSRHRRPRLAPAGRW